MAFTPAFTAAFVKPGDNSATRLPGEVINIEGSSFPVAIRQGTLPGNQNPAATLFPIGERLGTLPTVSSPAAGDFTVGVRQGTAPAVSSPNPASFTVGERQGTAPAISNAFPALPSADFVLMTGASVTFSGFRLLDENGGSELNYESYTTLDSDEQGTKGDGRVVIDRHTYSMYYEGDFEAAERITFFNAFRALTQIRFNGFRLLCSPRGMPKITRVNPLQHFITFTVQPRKHTNESGGYFL